MASQSQPEKEGRRRPALDRESGFTGASSGGSIEFAVNLHGIVMIKLEDIHSLSDFQRNAKAHVLRLKETGQPEVLTVNGKAELVVLAAETFQRLTDKVERAEAVEGIRRGLAEAKAGKGRPIGEAIEAIRKKHRVPKAS